VWKTVGVDREDYAQPRILNMAVHRWKKRGDRKEIQILIYRRKKGKEHFKSATGMKVGW